MGGHWRIARGYGTILLPAPIPSILSFRPVFSTMSFILPADAPTTDQYPEILLRTRANNPIKNNQCIDKLPLRELHEVEVLERKYAGMVVRRTDATAMYNCHGLSFASRRTRIIHDDALRLVLLDDCYIEVQPKNVLPGDVLLYVSATDGSFWHSAFVVSRPDEQFGWPMVVSKWGNGAEYIHRAHQCEYFIGARLVYHRVNS